MNKIFIQFTPATSVAVDNLFCIECESFQICQKQYSYKSKANIDKQVISHHFSLLY
jgi:hypothetical protein